MKAVAAATARLRRESRYGAPPTLANDPGELLPKVEDPTPREQVELSALEAGHDGYLPSMNVTQTRCASSPLPPVNACAHMNLHSLGAARRTFGSHFTSQKFKSLKRSKMFPEATF